MSQEFTPEYQALIAAGAMLANCAFNLAQSDKLDERQRRSLDESCKAWDAALPAYDATLRQPAARVDEGMLRNLAHLWRQIERSDEPQTEFDKGYEQASQECASTLEAALSAQPAPERQGEAFGYVDPVELRAYTTYGGALGVWKSGAYTATTPIYLHPAAPVGVPDGWKLVPAEPTEAMLKACDAIIQGYGAKLVYARMTAAAPSAPQGTQQGEG